MRPPSAIRAIGCIAHAALERSDGAWQPLPGFGDSPYVQAGGDIIWIGTSDALMHPRSVVLDGATRAVAGERLRAGALVPWRPPVLSFDARAVAALRAGCAALHRDLMRIGAPQGFAAMLAGRPPGFPLDRAAFRVRELAQSFDDNDVEAVYDAGLPLLGLGPGLTPSGDDLVGAALFVRRSIAGSPAAAKRWSGVAGRLIDAAQLRSHAIGAALFRDLAVGQSFAPLHRLAVILAAAAGQAQAIDAARALAAIGHSSGWDMLAGFIIGVTGAMTSAAERRIR